MEELSKLCRVSGYDMTKTCFLERGFTNRFHIGYRGDPHRQSGADNLPFKVGNKTILWNKLMKEVMERRVAGPFREVPFENFMQSPIGLVPKDNGKQTRLIFHLSYEFKDGFGSLNSNTPRELCSVQYRDLDTAVRNCLDLVDEMTKLGSRTGSCAAKPIFLAKTDVKSAFQILGLSPDSWMWLVMKAQDPCTGEWCYFVDKCLPFGASISCTLFQELSDALNHIFEYLAKVRKRSTNYLDDFLFIAATKVLCDALVGIFLDMCKRLNIPIALDKTYWGVTRLVFLGILLDGENLTLVVPWEKHVKALALLREFADKCKAKVKDLQSLCGYLNFLCRAIVPGRTFTRRMYSKYSNVLNNRTESGKYLSDFHHVRLDSEFKLDCKTWQWFLEMEDPLVVNRPMIDLSESVDSSVLNFYSDASANPGLGFGCIFTKNGSFSNGNQVLWPPRSPALST